MCIQQLPREERDCIQPKWDLQEARLSGGFVWLTMSNTHTHTKKNIYICLMQIIKLLFILLIIVRYPMILNNLLSVLTCLNFGLTCSRISLQTFLWPQVLVSRITFSLFWFLEFMRCILNFHDFFFVGQKMYLL